MEKEVGVNEEEREKILRMSEIPLILDTYDDIFSDFDPRPHSQRALSDDFLLEAKRASREKATGGIELQFLMPKAKRNLRDESLIKKRLKEHFKKHYDRLHQEKNKIIKQGAFFVFVGIILMFFATFVLFGYEKTALTSFLIIFLEPASWFLFWEGLNLIIFEVKKLKPDLDFYEKMIECEIEFLSY